MFSFSSIEDRLKRLERVAFAADAFVQARARETAYGLKIDTLDVDRFDHLRQKTNEAADDLERVLKDL